jgi:hypothetical protein
MLPTDFVALGRTGPLGTRLAAIAVLTALGMMALPAPAGAAETGAQEVADQNSDAIDAQNDALLAMPGQQTPVPQDSLYATAPGAEQRAAPTPFTLNLLGPLQYNSNATASNRDGIAALEGNPDVRLTYATQLPGSNLRFTAQLRGDGEYFGPLPRNQNINFLRLNFRTQYVAPDNDQAYSPYIAVAPRWTYEPLYATNIANRQDINLGVQKRFNFDGTFTRVPAAARTGSDTVWSFGLNVFGQERLNDPSPGSKALIGVLSASYVISSQWSAALAVDLTRRWFDGINGVSRNDFVVEPIATVEYSLPSSWFGGNSSLFGNPAIDFQASGEQQYSNITRREFTAFYIGAAFKAGFRFGLW